MGSGKDQETPEVSNTKEESSSEKTKAPDQVAPDHSQLDGQRSKLTTSSGLKVHGFKNEMISLEKMLKQRQCENEFKAIGIVGVQGVGKSTLCRALLNKAEIKTSFLPRIWVRMSKNKTSEAENSEKAVVIRMLKCLGVGEDIIHSISEEYEDNPGERLPALLYALHLQLNGKKYLIVLDDVWNSDDWYGDLSAAVNRSYNWNERLAYGLPKGNGGTVIVTSRKREVAEKMVGKENIHQLLPLWKQKSCWSIFADTVERENRVLKFELPEDFEQAKNDLFQKCGGLPLAAKMMGKTMAEKLDPARSETHDDGASREGPDHAGVPQTGETHDDGASLNGPPDHAGVPQISETHNDRASRNGPLEHTGGTQISETHYDRTSRNGRLDHTGVPQISETHDDGGSQNAPPHAGVPQISETHDNGASREGLDHAGLTQISETYGASRNGPPDQAGVPQISEIHDEGVSQNGPDNAGVPQISETHANGVS